MLGFFLDIFGKDPATATLVERPGTVMVAGRFFTGEADVDREENDDDGFKSTVTGLLFP